MQALIERATRGDRQALENLVAGVRDDVYRLALRMLWHPEDAEDATQDILIRVITHLGTFKGESAFTTWVYRVAANYLLTTRRRRAEHEELTFEDFGTQLARGLNDGPTWETASPERRLLIEEVKIGCSQGMLLCLDREHRLAYILGEILELAGPIAAAVLNVTPAAYRKRLSRARVALETFMRGYCGLVNREASCRCHKRVDAAVGAGRVNPDRLLFATDGDQVVTRTQAVEDLRDAVGAVQRSNPALAAPAHLVETLQRLLASEQFRVLRT